MIFVIAERIRRYFIIRGLKKELKNLAAEQAIWRDSRRFHEKCYHDLTDSMVSGHTFAEESTQLNNLSLKVRITGRKEGICIDRMKAINDEIAELRAHNVEGRVQHATLSIVTSR